MMSLIQKSRRYVIRLALSRAKPGSGTSLELLHRRTAMKKWPDLTPVLGDMPWAVIGGVATRCYMPERATVDLDIMIDRKHAIQAKKRMDEAGFAYKQELSINGSVFISPEGIEVDVLETEEKWLCEALKEARNNRDLQGLPVLHFEFFIVLKFRSGRVQDLADVSRMLGLASEEKIEKARVLFRELEPESLEDFENLVILGRLEVK